MTEPKKAAPGTLLEAILAVQGEVGTLRKDAVNPHFKSKYTPLDTIVETVGPILNKHGLVWMTFPSTGENGAVLKYVLSHAATNDEIADAVPLINPKNDMQGMGSAITYARRYALCAVLNLVADVDDDGNAAQAPKPADLARAKSRMTDRAKALLAEADSMKDRVTDPVPGAYQKYVESTGYTEEGLGRLVDYLKKHEAPDA